MDPPCGKLPEKGGHSSVVKDHSSAAAAAADPATGSGAKSNPHMNASDLSRRMILPKFKEPISQIMGDSAVPQHHLV
ncbi:MAG: hypothetical protein JHC88_19520 [Niveispirillum sp.]|nr:hypothetical protein [Niveispirillum sp.]